MVKISLKHTGDYAGLVRVQFPVVVEANDVYGDGSLFRVPFDVMRSVPGWMYNEGDTEYGAHYAFFGREVDAVFESDELPMKPIWINHNANGEITFSDTPEFRQEQNTAEWLLSAMTPPEEIEDNSTLLSMLQQMTTEKDERKEKLMLLILSYGIAITDGCYESECGNMDNMKAALEEEQAIFQEIKQMIQEGV